MIVWVLIIGSALWAIRPTTISRAAATVNASCNLIVPPDPLTAQGLATPYQLTATNPDNGPCDETNPLQTAFVQAAILNPATGQLSIYEPLIINQGTQPAVAPVVPTIGMGDTVAIWFGFNGDQLTLVDSQGSLQAGNCVNGVRRSIFGQVSYCNAPNFFTQANLAIKAGLLNPPPLGTAKDGYPCPTVRDFSIVDQDQSDNVTTAYLVSAQGQLAQMTATNMAQLPGATVLTNGSDNRLLSIAVDGALGCTPWMEPDLADNGKLVTALPLDELQAAQYQSVGTFANPGNIPTEPPALVPALDPMVVVSGKANLKKLNLYRLGVNQATVNSLSEADTHTYCKDLLAVAPARILLDGQFTLLAKTPDPAAANNLYTFLAQRFNTTWGANGGLDCQHLLGQDSPIKVTNDANGVAVSAKINGQQPTATTPVIRTTVINDPGQQTGPGNNTPALTCTVNGVTIPNCTGNLLLNGQICQFTYTATTGQLTILCPATALNP